MIRVQAVIKVRGVATRWLALGAGCSPTEVSLFMATLAGQLEAEPADIADVLDALLGEEELIVPGGLRLTDEATGTMIVPGCCAGLEGWREWEQLFEGAPPWLGHDPCPQVELVGEDIRVRQDRGDGRLVIVPRRALRTLLDNVERDLIGFRSALDAWGRRAGGAQRGSALAAAFESSFITG